MTSTSAPTRPGELALSLHGLGERADMLLIAGDLTRIGSDVEVDCVIEELSVVDVPIVAVLGNHDHHDGQPERVTRICWRLPESRCSRASRRSSQPLAARSA